MRGHQPALRPHDLQRDIDAGDRGGALYAARPTAMSDRVAGLARPTSWADAGPPPPGS